MPIPLHRSTRLKRLSLRRAERWWRPGAIPLSSPQVAGGAPGRTSRARVRNGAQPGEVGEHARTYSCRSVDARDASLKAPALNLRKPFLPKGIAQIAQPHPERRIPVRPLPRLEAIPFVQETHSSGGTLARPMASPSCAARRPRPVSSRRRPRRHGARVHPAGPRARPAGQGCRGRPRGRAGDGNGAPPRDDDRRGRRLHPPRAAPRDVHPRRRSPGLRAPEAGGPGVGGGPELSAGGDPADRGPRGIGGGGGRGHARHCRILDRGRGHRPDRDRPPAPKRPELHGAGLPRPRQRPHPQLRSHQDEQRGRGLGRPVRTGGDDHDRRTGEQRRRGGRPAPEHPPGRGAGIPDRHQPLRRGKRPLRRVRDQRRDSLRHRPAPWHRVVLPPGQGPPGPARDLRPHAGSPALRPRAVRPRPGGAHQERDRPLVRGPRVPRPERGRARGRARRPHPHDSPHVRRRAAQRLAGDRPPRLEPLQPRPPHPPVRLRERGRHGPQHARTVDRLRHPAPGQHQRLQRGARELGEDAVAHEPQHPRPQLQPLPERHRARRPRHAPAHLSLHPGRRLLPRSPGHEPGPLAARGQPGRRAGRPQPEVRGRGAAHRQQLRPRRLPGGPPRDGGELRGVRPQRRRAGERRRPALRGYAAERLSRPQPAPGRLRQHLLRLLRPGRLAGDPRADPEPRPALGDGHERQEHQRLSRHEPAGTRLLRGRPERGTRTTSARGSASTGRARVAASASTAAGGSTTTGSPSRSPPSRRASTAAPCPWR